MKVAASGVARATAIIVAGGTGSRMKTTRPKQFIDLAGKPLLVHTLSRFERCAIIDSVILVLPQRGFDDYRRLMSRWVQNVKPVDMVPGGDERQDSTRSGLEALPSGFQGLVAVHDGARPLVESDLITRVVEAAERTGGALAGLPVYETLKEVERDRVTGTIDRQRFYRAQTPQCFRYDILREALGRARSDRIIGTDESALVERMGVEVAIVPGSESNLKVTTARSGSRGILPRARKIGGGPVSFRIGLGFDAHRLVSDCPLVLGGVDINFDMGLEGHSDGDVVLHALTDALLGAVGGPDIGRLFPSGESRWKGAPSRIFVERAVQIVEERGYRIAQVDIVIIAEAPRLAPHFEAMQALIGELLGVSAGSVGVKATTTDGMGYMGRGEGMAAQAIALVSKLGEP